MQERFADLIAKLDEAEPGGVSERISRDLIAGVIALAEVLERIQLDARRIDELNEKLDTLNEKLDHFVKVLSSRG